MQVRRYDAYYFSFEPTDQDAVNKLLEAVAIAGKRFHNTEDWREPVSAPGDHHGITSIDIIQHAAEEAAKALREASKPDDRFDRLRAFIWAKQAELSVFGLGSILEGVREYAESIK